MNCPFCNTVCGDNSIGFEENGSTTWVHVNCFLTALRKLAVLLNSKPAITTNNPSKCKFCDYYKEQNVFAQCQQCGRPL